MRAFWGVVLVMMAGVAQAGALRAVSVVAGPDATRVVLETQARAPYHVFTLDRPDRVVVDLQGLRPSRHLLDGVAGRGVVRAVRESVQKDGLRIVFDVTGPVSANSFVMAPSGAFGNRVIVDLVPKAGTATTMAQATPAPKPVSTAQPVAAPIPSPPIASHSTALTVPVARGPMPSPVLPDPKANPAPLRSGGRCRADATHAGGHPAGSWRQRADSAGGHSSRDAAAQCSGFRAECGGFRGPGRQGQRRIRSRQRGRRCSGLGRCSRQRRSRARAARRTASKRCGPPGGTQRRGSCHARRQADHCRHRCRAWWL